MFNFIALFSQPFSLHARNLFSNIRMLNSLSRALCVYTLFSSNIFSNIESMWKNDDHALEWRINNVFIYVCEIVCVHSWQHSHYNHFSNKNKTIEHMFEVATRAHQMSIEFFFPQAFHCYGMSKWETDFMRWEKRIETKNEEKVREFEVSRQFCFGILPLLCLLSQFKLSVCEWVWVFLFSLLNFFDGVKPKNSKYTRIYFTSQIGEMNSDCELLLPLCCTFTSVRSAQSVLVCPSTRTVDKSTKCSHQNKIK